MAHFPESPDVAAAAGTGGLVGLLMKRFRELEDQRAHWDSHWEQLAMVIWPDADDFRNKRQPGEERAKEVFDATAALALEKFAAAMESLLTPRAQKWHRLKASVEELNKDLEVKEWLDETNRTLFRFRNSPRASFYSQKHEGYKSLGVFGNDCLFVDENPSGGLRYLNCHVGQIYTDIDQHGRVDTIFRKYPLTAKAAFQKWGDMIPEKIGFALKTEPFRSFDFLHVVLPRIEGFDPNRADALGMPWAAFDISIEEKHLIAEGGYHEMPYMYSRYTLNPTERYGRSPAMLVLPSVRMLQEMKKTHIRAGHKVADPPLLLFDDGVLGAGSNQVKLQSGGMNFGGLDEQGRALIKPLITGGRLDITEAMMETERSTINDAFLVTLFQILVDTPNMTATEALLRAQEKGQMLAPTVGRQQSEMLGPQIERELALLNRQGRLRPLPPALLEAQGEYDIEYESPATRMQRVEELVGVQRTIEIMAPFVQVDPGALEIFKADEVARLAADIQGVPASVLNTPEELAEIRQARQEAVEQQEQQAALQPGAAALKDASEAQLNFAQVPQVPSG